MLGTLKRGQNNCERPWLDIHVSWRAYGPGKSPLTTHQDNKCRGFAFDRATSMPQPPSTPSPPDGDPCGTSSNWSSPTSHHSPPVHIIEKGIHAQSTELLINDHAGRRRQSGTLGSCLLRIARAPALYAEANVEVDFTVGKYVLGSQSRPGIIERIGSGSGG